MLKKEDWISWKKIQMPKGPNGEKRPADTIGRAVQVAKIATGEIEDTKHIQPKKAVGAALVERFVLIV